MAAKINSTNPLSLLLPKCLKTFTPDILKDHNDTFLVIGYAMNSVFVIVINVLLIFGLVKTKKDTMTRSTKLFLFLCSSNLMVGLLMMPLQIVYIYLSADANCVEVGVRAFWNPFPLCLSGMHILVISIDRYLLVTKQRFYQKYVSDTVIVVVVIIELLISFGWGAAYAMVLQTYKIKPSGAYFLALSLFEAVILLSALFINLLLRIRVHNMMAKTTTIQRNQKVDSVILKTILLIAISLCICYLPSVICLAVSGAFQLTSNNRTHLRYTTIALLWSLLATSTNSGVNSLIYLLRNKKVKNFYRGKFRIGEAEAESVVGSANNITVDTPRTRKNYNTNTQL